MADTNSSAPPSPTEPDLSGRQLGDYCLLRRLGRGGMADVYLAEQKSLGRRVAFKVLRGSLAHDESYIRRFLNEARAAAALVHANIVQVHEVGNLDGVHFIAQEYVAGQNLRQYLSRSGALDVRLAVNIMRQVAAALQKAGQHGIVHRDIKPENIMLASTGEVKVADFGLARVASEAAMNLTQIGVTMGTPLYMSPEQVEGKTVDHRCDLYSLGVTCYHMLAGRPPFEGETPLGIAVQHLKDEPTRLEQFRPDLPSGLCRIVHKLLAKKPQDRFQQAADLLRELRALQIEGVDEAWPSGIDEWTSSELLALHTARVAATQQLDSLMKTEALQLRGARSAWRSWAIAVLVALFVGGTLAWANRPRSLLDTRGRQSTAIERKSTAQEQYFLALSLGTERALKSVAEFFPPSQNPLNEHYALRADQRLAEFYLDRDDLEAAHRTYDRIIENAASDSQLKVSGLIGKANVYAREDNHTAAVQQLTLALPLLRQMPRNTIQNVLPLLTPKLRAEMQRLYQDLELRDPGQPASSPSSRPNNRPNLPRTTGS